MNTPWLEPLPPRPSVIYDESSSTTVSTGQTSQCEDPHLGPHNRCRHATPPPDGYIRCHGEPGCAFRIPVASGERYCPFHRHLDIAPRTAEVEEMMAS